MSSLENLRNVSSLEVSLDSAHSCYLQDPFGHFRLVVRKWGCPAPHSTWSHCNLSIDFQSGFRMSCRHSHPSMGTWRSSSHTEADQLSGSIVLGLSGPPGLCRRIWGLWSAQRHSWEPAAPARSLTLAGEAETWVFLSQADGIGKLPISSPVGCRPGVPSLEIPSFWTSYHSLLPAGWLMGPHRPALKQHFWMSMWIYLPVEQRAK